MTWIQIQVCHLPAEQSQALYLISLNFSVLICANLKRLLQGVNEAKELEDLRMVCDTQQLLKNDTRICQRQLWNNSE
jgi:hypothetical protein